ncbi:MAG TPA: hypothetical protein VH914_20370 [Acidimicrobiia bacterium]|jgi:hypothetical protein|nr:hypothetical protein [Acidimicrobiia bacterium]
MRAVRPRPTDSAELPECVRGLRRIDEVRVIVGGPHSVAEVTGVAHRYPHTFRVPLAAANRLADAGVPLRIEHRGERGRTRW